jgi:hypothetical protein
VSGGGTLVTDREFDQWRADIASVENDRRRMADFLAKAQRNHVDEAEAGRILKRWKIYGKTLSGIPTQAELLVKQAMDAVIAAPQAPNGRSRLGEFLRR